MIENRTKARLQAGDTVFALGLYTGSEAMARTWMDKGARYVVTGAESLMARAMRPFLAEVKA